MFAHWTARVVLAAETSLGWQHSLWPLTDAASRPRDARCSTADVIAVGACIWSLETQALAAGDSKGNPDVRTSFAHKQAYRLQAWTSPHERGLSAPRKLVPAKRGGASVTGCSCSSTLLQETTASGACSLRVVSHTHVHALIHAQTHLGSQRRMI